MLPSKTDFAELDVYTAILIDMNYLPVHCRTNGIEAWKDIQSCNDPCIACKIEDCNRKKLMKMKS